MTDYAQAPTSGLPDPARRPEFYDGVALKRGLAWLFDVVLIGLVAAVLVPFTAFAAVFFFPVFLLVVGFLYRWATISGGSATWGMRLMAIELRNRDGLRFDASEAFLHTLGYSISVMVVPLQAVSVLSMLLSGRRQGLTDHVMGSAAINRML